MGIGFTYTLSPLFLFLSLFLSPLPHSYSLIAVHCQKKYKYKVTILNSQKRGKKAITRQLHCFDEKFRSVTDIKVHLMEELKDEVPSCIHFDVGYYEKRSSKCWLVTAEDLAQMYSGLKTVCCSVMLEYPMIEDLMVGVRKEMAVLHLKLMKKMLMNTTRHSQRSMVIVLVFLRKGYGREHCTVVLMIVMILHLHCLCSDLNLSGQKKTYWLKLL